MYYKTFDNINLILKLIGNDERLCEIIDERLNAHDILFFHHNSL